MAYIPPQYETPGSSLFKGATEGLQQQFIEPEAERRKVKLQLALESARIEAEMRARQAAQQIPQGEFNQISGGLGGLTQGLLGPNAQVPNFSGVTSVAGQQAALGGLKELAAGAARSPGLQFLPSRDENGNMSFTPVNKRTGQVGNPLAGGRTAQAADKIANAKSAFENARLDLDSVRQRISNFLGAKSAADLPAQVANLKLNQILQNNPVAKAYFDDLPALSLRLDKQLTGSSRFAKEIVDATAHGLPNMTDTAMTAMAKLDNYEGMFHHAKMATYKAYSLPPDPEDNRQTSNAPVVSPAAKQYLQGLNLGQPQGQ